MPLSSGFKIFRGVGEDHGFKGGGGDERIYIGEHHMALSRLSSMWPLQALKFSPPTPSYKRK